MITGIAMLNGNDSSYFDEWKTGLERLAKRHKQELQIISVQLSTDEITGSFESGEDWTKIQGRYFDRPLRNTRDGKFTLQFRQTLTVAYSLTTIKK
jgi:hypothetical protein